jgi:F-type H+-transporting ATPase subunit epsilon
MVDIVSAEEQIFSGEAEFVVLPGVMGELGIYPAIRRCSRDQARAVRMRCRTRGASWCS